MPGYDGTGPNGEGSLTGGGFGNCVPKKKNNEEENVIYGLGRGGKPRGGGRGRGRGGRGRGRRNFALGRIVEDTETTNETSDE